MYIIFIDGFTEIFFNDGKFFATPCQQLCTLKDSIAKYIQKKASDKDKYDFLPEMTLNSEYKIVLLYDPGLTLHYIKKTYQKAADPLWGMLSDTIIAMTPANRTKAEEVTAWLSLHQEENIKYVVIGNVHNFFDKEGKPKGFSLNDDLMNHLFLYHPDLGFCDKLSWQKLTFALFSQGVDEDFDLYGIDLRLIAKAAENFRQRGLTKINIIFLDLDGVMLFFNKASDEKGVLRFNVTARKNLLDLIHRSRDTTRIVITSARRYQCDTMLMSYLVGDAARYVIGSTASDPSGENNRAVEINNWLKTYSKIFHGLEINYLIIDDSANVLENCHAANIAEGCFIKCNGSIGFQDCPPLSQQSFTEAVAKITGMYAFFPPKTQYALRRRKRVTAIEEKSAALPAKECEQDEKSDESAKKKQRRKNFAGNGYKSCY